MDPLQSAAVLAGCCTLAGCGCAAFDPETINTYCYPAFPQPPPPHSAPDESLRTPAEQPPRRRRSLVSKAVDNAFRILGCLELSSHLSPTAGVPLLPTNALTTTVCPSRPPQDVRKFRQNQGSQHPTVEFASTHGLFGVLLNNDSSTKNLKTRSAMITTTQSTADPSSFRNSDNTNKYTYTTTSTHDVLPDQLLSSSSSSLSSSQSSEYSYDTCESDSVASSLDCSTELSAAILSSMHPSLRTRSQTTIVMRNQAAPLTPTQNLSPMTKMTHDNQSMVRDYYYLTTPKVESNLMRQSTSPAPTVPNDPELQSTYFLKRAYESRRLSDHSGTVCVL